MADVDRIGIKPQFERRQRPRRRAADAGFDVITVAPDRRDRRQDRPHLDAVARSTPTTSGTATTARGSGRTITTTSKVANGTVDTTADRPGARSRRRSHYGQLPARGRQRPATTRPRRATSSMPATIIAEAGSDTPDTLQVALDKPAYKAGDTAHLRLDPQFAGTALVMVVDDRIIDMKAVDVPAGGTTVDLPVTADWGPGAYVTATLYRPAERRRKADAGARARPRLRRRRSGRPQARRRASMRPRRRCRASSFTTTIKLGNVAAGDEGLCGRGRRRSRHPQPHATSRCPIRTAGISASASSASSSAISTAS